MYHCFGVTHNYNQLYNRQVFLIIRSLIHQSLQVRGLDPNLVCLNGQRFLGIPQSTRQNGAWSAPWSSLQCGWHQQATRNVSKKLTSSSLEKGLEKYPLEMKYHELSPIAGWCSIGASKPSPVQTKRYWKWPFIVEKKPLKMVDLSIVM